MTKPNIRTESSKSFAARNRSPFARMELRDGKHYFNIFESDGQWHTYPVDYTIGSKWQQAYATKLANGQIHVFPIQYSALEKQWLNYWKVIDSPRQPTRGFAFMGKTGLDDELPGCLRRLPHEPIAQREKRRLRAR